MTLVFIDTETTGLDRDRHQVWEIGAIVRRRDGGGLVDVEHQWMLRPKLGNASPEGLRIGRYYERMGSRASWPAGNAWRIQHPEALDPNEQYDAYLVAADVAQLLDGATLVGAVPDFDAEMLRRWLRANDQAATWHYHLVDIETFAAGALGLAPPWNFDELLASFGLAYDEADRHTALGDARMVRDLYNAVLALSTQ